MIEFLETGESVWCVNCGHHFNDHKPKPSDSPPNFFDHAREYLGCKEGCECKKFTPSYQIESEKINKILEKENIVTQTEQQENTKESTTKKRDSGGDS
jgi:hypothetical protein